MRVKILLLCASAFVGCSALREHLCRDVAPTVVQNAECLHEPPPSIEPVWIDGPEEGCPAAFVGCLRIDAGQALDRNLRAKERWMREAWSRCGPADAGR